MENLPVVRHGHGSRRPPGGWLAMRALELGLGEVVEVREEKNSTQNAGRRKGNSPSKGRTRRPLDLRRKFPMESLGESGGQGKKALVPVEPNDISRSFQKRGAIPALPEVCPQSGPLVRVEIVVDVVRYFSPDVFATHVHGLFPFWKDRRLVQLPSRPGASRSRNIRRARSRRVFTAPTEMPSAAAVSAILNSCTSRSTKTSRETCASELRACTSALRISFRSSASEG